MQLRVVYSSNPAGNSTEDAAFLEWLSGHEGQSLAAPARSARIAVVGHTFKPIPASLEAPELQHASAAAAASQSAAQQDARQPIVTPSFVNVQIAQDQGVHSTPCMCCTLASNIFDRP